MSDSNPPETAEQICEWLTVLVAPDSTVEMRIVFKVRPPIIRHYASTDLPRMAHDALQLGKGAKGVYWLMNPLPAEWQGTPAKDEDIVRRRWLLVDCDPRRKSGVSSTDTEKTLAEAKTKLVYKALMARGWPRAIVADSANGWHLLFRIDLPADDGELVARCLKTLDRMFSDDGVDIDTTVSNESRICKMYGTQAAKGENTPERPHRVATIIKIPETLDVVPVELLHKLASEGEQPTAPAARSPQKKLDAHPAPKVASPQQEWRADDAVMTRATAYAERVPGAIEGENGSKTTFALACCLMKGFDLGEDQALSVLKRWNSTCKPPWTEGELRHKLRDAAKASGETGYLRHAKPERWDSIRVPEYRETTRTFAGIDASELATYSTQEPHWLVQDMFTDDEPLLVGARSKCCKTLQLSDLAVALASGTPWMGTFSVPQRRKVLLISGEANKRRMSRDIAKACNRRGITFRNLEGFLRVEAVQFPGLPSLDDQEGIRRDVERHGIEVVVVDPLYRALSGVDSAQLNQVGSAIKSFQAACSPACLILSHHVVKSAAREYGSPPSLEDMTGAGVAESCGQWWLCGRNVKYGWDGMHDLCVSYGGREGQAGGRRIVFDERLWTFEVESMADYIAESDGVRQRQQAAAKSDAESRKLSQARAKILAVCQHVGVPQSRTYIRDCSGQSGATFGAAMASLLSEQTLLARPYRDSQNRIKAEGLILSEYAPEYDIQWRNGEVSDCSGSSRIIPHNPTPDVCGDIPP